LYSPHRGPRAGREHLGVECVRIERTWMEERVGKGVAGAVVQCGLVRGKYARPRVVCEATSPIPCLGGDDVRHGPQAAAEAQAEHQDAAA
jgi:hypothetical protein